ncbi:L-threonine synthase [Halanaerobium saccharolyticum]|uniref:Threonine synthase n=1 Tax=Halanaerobium saccharolyticum TaxID=43595 RepID=A0A4R7Z905_9FIRM|nr:threonine synthase [Halanaerobium saccharolyticum]RAK09328.1 L-threonine synthase [Halanaerobium saccharolyticum]TDW06187.1 L-threonine synthase [Halanaerobium saccharolyticum]TDX60981.1 L-threonine synthase [Halanaerobium saccharolyticum]
MEYISTRGNYKNVSSAEAISLGMVPEGGLFVPEEIPKLELTEIMEMKDQSYQELAVWIFNKFLSDFTEVEIEESVKAAYQKESFPLAEKTPLVKLDQNTYILELWHGPTAAFKDMALQILPQLLVRAVKKLEVEKEIVILVATSGDTGKAALEGFKDVEGIKIIVFYPEDGVSRVQEDQMKTTGGSNTEVVSLEGNFDDCQTAVKNIFADKEFRAKLEANNFQFSSANSINWGRLLPQIVYYFKAYFEIIKDGGIKTGDKINIAVPTGNFGNILAAYYAYQIGLPVNKFICASNDNKVLADFLETGIYDIEREFKKTISPSMDILISSNLERFLFEITDHNSSKINEWYQKLKTKNKFEVDQQTKTKIQNLFSGHFSTEKEAREVIKSTFNNFNYLLDPHTAVGVDSLNKYRQQSKDQKIAVIASTANPYKFSRAVLESLKEEKIEEDEYRIIEELNNLTAAEVHRGLRGLEDMESRHQHSCDKNTVKEKVAEILKL